MDLEVICHSNLGYQIFCLQKESSSNGEMSEYWVIHFKFTLPYMDKGTRKNVSLQVEVLVYLEICYK